MKKTLIVVGAPVLLGLVSLGVIYKLDYTYKTVYINHKCTVANAGKSVKSIRREILQGTIVKVDKAKWEMEAVKELERAELALQGMEECRKKTLLWHIEDTADDDEFYKDFNEAKAYVNSELKRLGK